MKMRTTIEIIVNVLEVTREPIIKTHIMYQTNLNGDGLTRYLGAFISSGLISKGVGTKTHKKKTSYVRTEKGTRLLTELKKTGVLLTEFSMIYNLQQEQSTKR